RAFDEALKATAGALDWLRAQYASGDLPLLRYPERRDDLDGIGTAAERLCADASDVVFMGTGGSSLGGQTPAQLSGHAGPGLGLPRGGPPPPFLDHDTKVGGRYSVLTNVGMLPAAIAGLDIKAIRDGAANALAPVLANQAPRDVPAAVGAALAYAGAQQGKSIAVLMAYADRLE